MAADFARGRRDVVRRKQPGAIGGVAELGPDRPIGPACAAAEQYTGAVRREASLRLEPYASCVQHEFLWVISRNSQRIGREGVANILLEVTSRGGLKQNRVLEVTAAPRISGSRGRL